MELIKVYGKNWCPVSRRAVRILHSQSLSSKFIDIDTDESGRQYVEKVNHGCRSVPTIIFPNGFTIVEPSDLELIHAIAENLCK